MWRVRTCWVVVSMLMGCAGRLDKGDDGESGMGPSTDTGAGASMGTGGMVAAEGSGGNAGSGGFATGVGGAPTAGGHAGGHGGGHGGGQGATGASSTSAGGAAGTMGATGSGGMGAAGGSGGGASSDELCEWGSYDTNQTDDELTCEEWTPCQPGEYLAEQGGFWKDNDCEPCSKGTFSQNVNQRHCIEWHRCKLGEQVAVEPSIVNDRTCEPAESFAPHSGAAVGLTLTSEGPQLLVAEDRYPLPVDAFVASYSLAGQSLGQVSPTGTNTEVQDLVFAVTSVGDEVFVVGHRYSGAAAPGYVRKISKNGTIEWETALGSEADYLGALAVSATSQIYVAAEVYKDGEGPSRVQLYVLDPADGSLSNPTLEDNPTGSPVDIEVAANGHIYLAGVASPVSSSYPGATVMEFDATGAFIAERELADDDWLIELASDGSGGVYALGSHQPQRLYHLDTGGDLLFAVDLGMSEPTLEAMTSTPDGVLLVGRDGVTPVLLTTDPSGEVTTTEVLEDIEGPVNFSGIQLAPDGSVFVAGTNMDLGGLNPVAFVARWPE